MRCANLPVRGSRSRLKVGALRQFSSNEHPKDNTRSEDTVSRHGGDELGMAYQLRRNLQPSDCSQNTQGDRCAATLGLLLALGGGKASSYHLAQDRVSFRHEIPFLGYQTSMPAQQSIR